MCHSGGTVRLGSLQGTEVQPPGRLLGRQRLLTSPFLNWLVVKSSYKRKGSWCAWKPEAGGAVLLKTKDSKFMESRYVFCWSRPLEQGPTSRASSAGCSQSCLAKTPKSPRIEVPQCLGQGPLLLRWIWEENVGVLVLTSFMLLQVSYPQHACMVPHCAGTAY